jgi:type VI secretion system protein ImpB
MEKDDLNAEPRVNLSYKSSSGSEEETELPFKVLIMGNFTHSEDPVPLNDREPLSVTNDNLNAVMEAMSPSLKIMVEKPSPGEEEPERIPVSLKFKSLSDFEPKMLLKNIEPFRKVMDLRKALLRARKALAANPILGRELNLVLKDPKLRERLLKELKEAEEKEGNKGWERKK